MDIGARVVAARRPGPSHRAGLWVVHLWAIFAVAVGGLSGPIGDDLYRAGFVAGVIVATAAYAVAIAVVGE